VERLLAGLSPSAPAIRSHRSGLRLGAPRPASAARLAMLMGIVILWPLIVTSPVQAASTCGAQSGEGNYFDGYGNGPHDAYGVSAFIVVRPSSLCSPTPSGGTNFTAAWTAIGSNGLQGYAQSGYDKEAATDNVTRPFTEYKKNNSVLPTTNFYPTHLFAGEQHKYTTRFTSACVNPGPAFCLAMEQDNTALDTTPWNPQFEWVNRPWHPQYSLEASYQASDVPGSPTAKTNYTNMVYQDAPAQSWSDEPCGYSVLIIVKDRSDKEHAATHCHSANFWTTGP
jgi:hypothetical protein